jgi:hypothetical protein
VTAPQAEGAPETPQDRTGTGPDGPASSSRHVGSIEDAAGDVQSGTPLQDPPAWVDLREVRLERLPDGFELTVEFDAPVPVRRDDERITNVATFYDVDGDGELDYQIYATSTSDGWGSAHYDHVAGRSRYGDDDGIDVTVEDGVLVLRFSASHLGQASRFQWSAATQWGTLAELEAGTDARDRAPDDGRAVLWP